MHDFNLNMHEVLVYTDGSCNSADKSGGWAWLALDDQSNMIDDSGYYPGVTNNKMELYAPTHSLNTLYEKFGALEITVYSDSEYVIKGITNKKRARRVNLNWWRALEEAVSFHEKVTWVHVRGHSKNFYNELVDKMAGEARKEGNR